MIRVHNWYVSWSSLACSSPEPWLLERWENCSQLVHGTHILDCAAFMITRYPRYKKMSFIIREVEHSSAILPNTLFSSGITEAVLRILQ
jgi:hypothetical protein